jgi:hypothetical protein
VLNAVEGLAAHMRGLAASGRAVTEVVLDIGRFPRVLHRDRGSNGPSLSEDVRNFGALTTVVLLQHLCNHPDVGNFDRRGRAAVKGTLHRVARLCSPTGEAVGLTFRVRQAASGAAQLMQDVS